MSILLNLGLFFGEIIGIFLLSRQALLNSYQFLSKFFKKEKWIIFIVSFVYFPGTLIHEISHYIVALLLNLHPSEIHLFPVVEGRKVKLGHVLYEKHRHDFIRSILVGVAPFFGALFSLWIIIQANLFPGTYWWQTIVFGYLILTITANMFSSKQDLIDVGYLIPIGIVIGFIFYLFPLQLSPQVTNQLITSFLYFFHTIQPPLLFSVVIHAILVILLMKFK